MQTRNRNPFTTIHTEGAILPSDLLQRVLENDKDLVGLSPEGYHLSGEKLTEATTRSWNRLQGSWAAFRTSRGRLGAGEAGTTLTRERWLLPLFQELGYGRLLTSRAVEIEGKSYPISHGWANVPIHLVGCGVDLDKRSAGVAGASRSSPHSLMQEYLNRSEESLWGFISNGLRLRVLRDNASLTRQAFLEFDLEAMFEGEVYSDFVLLWLMCHQSRAEADSAAEFILEQWSKTAQEQGTRALDQLRSGVEQAISALGSGFLRHPANGQLRADLRSGALSPQEYYRQLLRLVYRLIFLFVAEERDLLFDPGADPPARERYTRYYSLNRLRRLAERQRGGRHADLYESVKVVSRLLGVPSPATHHSPLATRHSLGLPALGSFLFSGEAVRALESAELENQSFLSAIRHLTFIEEGRSRRAVDYKNLGAEELGSVYEALLELHPDLNTEAGTFALSTAGGNERKTTGSYYTPSSLIQVLIDSALEPVIGQALGAGHEASTQEQALLDLKVCDPACGSGHFLIAAAHRIARRLAAVRSGDDEPSPAATRAALREVIAHCIYGVDANPMAVELCKVNLWLESLAPGKPLSFLDAHIQCGDSLVGVAPGLDISEVPDEAFNPAFGDDKATSTALKKRNKREKKQMGMRFEVTHVLTSMDDLAHWLAERAAQVDAMPEDDPAQVGAKAQAFDDYHNAREYLKNRLELDLWTAAFFWKYEPMGNRELGVGDLDILAPTQGELVRLRGGGELDARLVEKVRGLSERLNFFHWELAFPKVFSGENSGFDCVLGNPPWERPEFHDETHWADDPYISDAPSVNVRVNRIQEYRNSKDEVVLKRIEMYDSAKHNFDAESKFIVNSSRYKLSAVGKYNYYAIFAEHARNLISGSGRAGIIIPTGIATDDTTKEFFSDLIKNKSLVSLLDFENRNGIFPSVHRSYKFCAFTMSKMPVAKSELLFFATKVEHIRDTSRRFVLNANEISLFNPNTNTMPVFRTKQDADLSKKIYKTIPILHNEISGKRTWSIVLKRMFNMGLPEVIGKAITTEKLIAAGEKVDGVSEYTDNTGNKYLPVYEGKMFNFYDHRTASVELNPNNRVRAAQSVESSVEQRQNPYFFPTPAYWMPENELKRSIPIQNSSAWVIAYKDVTASTNDRTMIATVLPHSSSNFTVRCVYLEKEYSYLAPCLLSNLNSIVFDFVARQSLAGLHLSDYIVKQLPFLPPSAYTTADIDFIAPRVLELVYTAYDLRPFADDMWNAGIGNGQSGVETTPNSQLTTSRHLIIKQWESNYGQSIHSILPRLASLAGGDEFGGNVLSPDQSLSKGRDVWNDKSDSQGGSVSPSKHSGGVRTGETGRVHSLSANRSGVTQGSGDSPAAFDASRTYDERVYRAIADAMRDGWQNPESLDTLVTTLITTPNSPLPILPFRWDEVRRARLRAELDAYYARLYDLTRDELRYILDPKEVYGEDFPGETFRVLKEKEIRQFGEYRTRRLVLEAWDQLEGVEVSAFISSQVGIGELKKQASQVVETGISIEKTKRQPPPDITWVPTTLVISKLESEKYSATYRQAVGVAWLLENFGTGQSIPLFDAQKFSYFLQRKGLADLDIPYKEFARGPYSPQVTYHAGAYAKNQSFWEVLGKNIARRRNIKKAVDASNRVITELEQAQQLVEQLTKMSQDNLGGLATVDFASRAIFERGKAISPENIRAYFQSDWPEKVDDPWYTDENINHALEFLTDLGLFEKSASSKSAASAKKEHKPVEDNSAQPMLSDFGLYKCGQCGKLVMGYEKGNHEKTVHGGRAVEWRKVR